MRILMLLFLLFPALLFAQSDNKKAQEAEAAYEYTTLNPATDKALPADFVTNYNTGIRIYNKGVDKISEAESNDDPTKGLKLQEEAAELFREALPFLEKAYSFDKKHKSTLTALAGVYFALDNMEKFKEYNKQLEALEQK